MMLGARSTTGRMLGAARRIGAAPLACKDSGVVTSHRLVVIIEIITRNSAIGARANVAPMPNNISDAGWPDGTNSTASGWKGVAESI
jgi:hypothetical protein